MKAVVYALFRIRPTAFDHYMVCGSEQEALDYYRKVTGLPGQITTEGSDDAGHRIVFLDEKGDGSKGVIAQYIVGIDEWSEE